jgi:pyroglutamyl-peptidase
MKVLITGFDPFGGELVNPSYEAVRRLPNSIGGAKLIKLELPTVFADSGAALEQALAKYQPDAVFCVGQAGGYAAIAVEQVAINLRDAQQCDNAGVRPVDEPVIPDGPAAYFATLPVKKIVTALREQDIPAFVSHSAGTFVCNNVMYTLLHWSAVHNAPILGGFIHVPYVPEQAAHKGSSTPSMALEQMERGLKIAIQVTLAQIAQTKQNQ